MEKKFISTQKARILWLDACQEARLRSAYFAAQSAPLNTLSKNYTITVNQEINEAVSSIEKNPPSLIIINLSTVGIKGLSLVANAQIPVIVIGDRAGEELCLEGLSLGATDYLIEPFSANELLTRVQLNLKLAQMEQQLKTEAQNKQENLELQQAYRKSESRLRLAQQAAKAGTWDWYMTTNTVSWSDEYYLVYGIDKETCSPSYENWLNCLLASDREAANQYIVNALQQGQDIDLEFRIWHQQKGIRWLNAKGQIIRDETGQAVRMVGISIDITERKRIEQERQEIEKVLRQEKERFELAAKAVNCLIYDWNLETDTVERTDGLTRLFGYLPEDAEPTAQWWSTLIHPEDLERSRQVGWEALMNQDHCVVQYRVRKKDNQYAHVEDHCIIVRDESGKPVRVVGSTMDISDRITAEKALRAANEKITNILESMSDAFVAIDRSFRLTYINREARRLNEYKPSEYFIGKTHWEVWPWSVGTIVEQNYRRALAEQQPVNFEVFYNNKIWLEIHAYPSEDGIGIFFRDITERKFYEVALKDSEARFKAFMNHNPAGSWIVDRVGRFIYLNSTYYEMFDFPKQDVIGKTIAQIYSEEIAEQFLKNNQQVFATSKVIETIEIAPRPDGSMGEFLVYKFPIIRETGESLLGGVAIDITERNRAERALKESEERFRQMAVTIKDVFWLIDLQDDFKTLYVSPSYEEIWGYSSESLYQNPNQWLLAIHPEDRQRVQDTIYQCEKFDTEYRLIRPDGSIRWIRSRGYPVVDENGGCYRLSGIAEDITARKEAEAALRETTAILNAINQSTPSLIYVKDCYGRLIMANPATLVLIGKPESEVIGFTDLEYTPNRQLAEQIMANDRLVIETGQILSCEEVTEFPNGGRRTYLSVKQPYRDEQGNIIGLIGVSTDITERKLSEEALKRSEAKFRRLVEANIFGVAIGDFYGNMFYANDALLNMIGYTREELEAGLVRWIDLTPPELVYLDWQAGEELRQQGVCKPFEKAYIHKDGHRVPILMGAALLEQPYDSQDQIIGFYIDLTELKQTETALEEQRLLLETILKQAADGVIVCNASGEVTFTNAAALKMAGVEPEDPTININLLGWGSAYDPQGNPIPVENYSISKALRGEVTKAFESRMVRSDGSYYDILISSAPLVEGDGQIVGAVGTFMDISDRKRIEEELRRSEVRFRATFEQAAVGFAHVSIDGHWLRVNQKLCRILGYSRDELLGKTFQEITYPEDLEADLNYVQELLSGKRETYSMEKRYVCKNGSLIWVELTVSLVLEPSDSQADESIYFISVLEDISDRKQAQQALQERAKELSELNKALSETMSVLKNRNKELDQFAYIVSHDLKAPLRAISNLSLWIQEDLEGQLPPENQKQLQLMQQRVIRMEKLIDGLLEFSRIGRKYCTAQTISVADLLAEVIDSLSPPSSFTIEIGSNMPTLITQRILLNQIFANLIGNAIKHHPRTNGRVSVTVKNKDNFYEFAVADDGKGIAPEHHKRIFDLFQTLEKSDNNDSTGIGLAIVKKIIDNVGGTIKVESDIGQGTTFRFIWPK